MKQVTSLRNKGKGNLSVILIELLRKPSGLSNQILRIFPDEKNQVLTKFFDLKKILQINFTCYYWDAISGYYLKVHVLHNALLLFCFPLYSDCYHQQGMLISYILGQMIRNTWMLDVVFQSRAHRVSPKSSVFSVANATSITLRSNDCTVVQILYSTGFFFVMTQLRISFEFNHFVMLLFVY